MPQSIADQVIDFYQSLFDKIFSEPFRPLIAERLKRNAVMRQIEESADAASQSLIRTFTNERLSEQQVREIISVLDAIREAIRIENVSNPRVTPEGIVESKLKNLSCPESISKAGREAVFGVALHSVTQSLILFGPVMTEWKKTGFSAGFDPPQRFVSRLNEFSEKQDSLKASGGETEDELFKLIYLDYLIQRFFRVEAGTMQMAANFAVDLRDLFVMPRVLERPEPEKTDDAVFEAMAMMDLAVARQLFLERDELTSDEEKATEHNGVSAFDQVRKSERAVIIGTPGSGKSTFFEWLQLQVASGAEDFIAGDQQAIPLIVRVRQLDPHGLPQGRALIEKATASRDISKAMPANWIERQMEAGRVLFMLDGLDETEPQLRDERVIPWFAKMIQQYPDCRYLVSSRPVGYPPGALRELGFIKCDLLDFGEDEIAEYTQHWCTSIRLSRNEPEEEARREGAKEGGYILNSFKDHAYIRNLARNPLMLSAICLVNSFEGGDLPKDRARLYRLCVEGLLYNWDKRRGIHSEFGLSEKLRVCRELAIEMQANDKAEYPAENVLDSFALTLDDKERAAKLLENIRYRTGLLIERRPRVFAFAHLTFQEYLGAQAVVESNRQKVSIEQLAREHSDGRWTEVIALYCGIAPAPSARNMIEELIAQSDSIRLADVLSDAYLSSVTELYQDQELRNHILERIALAPWSPKREGLLRFSPNEVAPISNQSIGRAIYEGQVSEGYMWLVRNSEYLDTNSLFQKLKQWQEFTPEGIAELMILSHRYCPDEILAEIAIDAELYQAPVPKPLTGLTYQASFALFGFFGNPLPSSIGRDIALLQILRTLCQQKEFVSGLLLLGDAGRVFEKWGLPRDESLWLEFASLARLLASRLEKDPPRKETIIALNSWADKIEAAVAEKAKQKKKTATKSPRKQTSKKAAKGGRKR